MNISRILGLVGRAVLCTPRDHATKRRRAARSDAPLPTISPHEIDQELAPKVNHSAPGNIFTSPPVVVCLRTPFVNVVRDLVAQDSFLDVSLGICSSIERFRSSAGFNFVSPQKFAMTLDQAARKDSIRPACRFDPGTRGEEFQNRRTTDNSHVVPNRAVLRCATKYAGNKTRKSRLLISGMIAAWATIFLSVEQSEKPAGKSSQSHPASPHVNEPFRLRSRA